MTALVWHRPDQARQYDYGISQGVLYPLGGPGVVWNGLVSAETSSDGGDVTSFYFDGIKYLDLPSNKSFQGKLQVLSAPTEFEPCLGYRSVIPGFIITRQDKSRFGLSYRTETATGYKLHLIYNAVATQSGSRSFDSLTSTTSPVPLDLTLDAVPVEVDGIRPTAYFVVDSNETSPDAMAAIEGILYGNPFDPRLPTMSELQTLLAMRFVIVIPSPDVSLVPPSAKVGDIVFSISDEGVYSYGSPASDNVRPVIEIEGNDPSLLPKSAVVGDLVYDTTTGVLYKIGA